MLYSAENLRDGTILDLARRVRFHADPSFPGPGRFKGAVTARLKDGSTLTEVEEYNRGSAENPMSDDEIRAKFDENAEGILDHVARDRVVSTIEHLETVADARTLVDLVVNE